MHLFVPSLFLFISINGAATLSSSGSRRPALAFHVGLCRACPWSGTRPCRFEPGCCLRQREPRGIYQACSDSAEEALGDRKQDVGPNRRCQATRSCGVTSDSSGGALPGARPSQEPPSEATWGSQWGARWRARDPRFPGPCGGTGHVDTTRGASGGPVGLSRSRGESSTLAPLSHPSLDGLTWCWGSPNRSLVHGYGALYWKALRRNPHPGQQGQPASWEPRVPVPFRAGQRGRASPRLWVAVSSWRKAFSLWNFQHSRLPGPRVQSVPQVPPLVAPSRQKHRKEPSALARRRPTARLQFWEPAEGLSDAGRLGGPSRGQASTQLTVGAGRRAWRRSTEKERSQEMME